MEFTLIAVTLLSLFLAISMGVVVWRLVREERRRSAARLAALAAELRRGRGAAGNEEPGAGFEPPPSPRAGSSAHPEPGLAGAGGGPRRRGSSAYPEPAGAGAGGGARRRGSSAYPEPDLFVPEPSPDSGAAADPLPGGGLFSPPVESTSTGRGRLAAFAGAAVVVLAAVAALFLLSEPDAGAGEDAAPDGGRPPLDLIALEHAAEGPFLDIRGAVRNPPRAPGAERLSVVATAFDAAGTLVATRRAPVETPSLPPGADSPFTVRLLAAGVSRYRISFLLDDATVPHVDRRPAGRPPAFTGDSS